MAKSTRNGSNEPNCNSPASWMHESCSESTAMTARTWRKTHRTLGLVIGVQLLFWSASGAYFSWNAIKGVRGENMIRSHEPIDLKNSQLISLNEFVNSEAVAEFSDRKLVSVLATTMLDRPVLELTYNVARDDDGVERNPIALLDALSGERLSPIDQDTACEIALADFTGKADIQSVDLINATSAHSEYRGKELPAWRVVLDHPTGTVIYVSAHRGTVTSRRNNRWRIFDFLWMLHTMDYQGRDNFNHWVLKVASLFGIVTVLSGFGLWFKTSRMFQRRSNQTVAANKPPAT